MEIQHGRSKFSNLALGDAFVSGNEAYMRISVHKQYNAVNLRNGDLASFQDCDPVSPKEATVVMR